jgi:hypothetical protein
MTEGWHDKEYLILFDQPEIDRLGEAYSFPPSLSSYRVVGLCGWDDFVLQNQDGSLVRIPTVPLDVAYIMPLQFRIESATIQPDSRFTGKIKWYIKPLAFGGDATAQTNMAWLSLEQHIEAVKWWNQMYREIQPHIAK